MPGPFLRPFLPILLAGAMAACGPLAPQEGPTRPLVDMGGSGPGKGADTALVKPVDKPAHPKPPPRKPIEGSPVQALPTEPRVARTDLGPAPQAQPARPATRPASEPARPRTAPPVEPQVQASALPPVKGLSGLPSDPVEVTRLRTRPPMTPPVDTAFDAAIDRAAAAQQRPGQAPAAALASAEARCREAVRAAREAVNQYLSMPPEAIPATAWVEDALRVTEVALRACQGQSAEEAATYWRATAFFLHGQYARAALNYRRVADMEGPFNALGYAANLSVLLQTCGDDRAGLDAFRLGGLYEASGHPERAATQYGQAARSACVPLRDTAEARLRVMAERLSRGAASR